MTSASPFQAHQPFARGLLLITTVVTLVLGLGAGFSTAAAETTGQAAAHVSVTASTPVVASTGPSATGCWVTGDLVGEGNPVEVARALCGSGS